MNFMKKNTLLLAGASAGIALAMRQVQRRPFLDVQGKLILITGGSRGLGLVIARQLAEEGARLVICARDPAELEQARLDLSQRGAQVLAIPCDLTEQEQVERLFEMIHSRWGEIDVLINNAGVIEVGPMEVMTLEDYQEAMNTHFWAVLYTTLAVLPEMRRRRSGRIVNITSIGGKVAVPHLLPYSTSKFAATGLSEGLRSELAKDGIVVTTICPGLMRTGSPVNAIFKSQHRTEYTLFTIMDALPLFSTSAEQAARRIILALKRGEGEVVLTIQARILEKFHALFPGLTADLLGLANRLLPGPGGIGAGRALGKDSTTALAPSVLTSLSDAAAERNNEFANVSRDGHS